MVYRDIKDAEETRKLNRFLITMIGILLFFAVVYIGYMIETYSLEKTEFTLIMTIFLTALTMGTSTIQWLGTNTNSTQAKLKESEIQQIKDSMDMFYVPLLNLLTIYNENVTCKTKVKMMIEVNSHKHLAEPAKPSVLSLLEVYLKGNAESKVVSGELLELVSRDMENLQKRFIELRNM